MHFESIPLPELMSLISALSVKKTIDTKSDKKVK